MGTKKEDRSNSGSVLEETLRGCYGSHILPSQVKEWLVENIMSNIDRETRVTLNITSCPGVGKTSIVKSLATTPVEWNGKKYDGFQVVDIPLAQIEEMGDVLGYPVEEIKMEKGGEVKWIKAVDSLIKDFMEKGWTTDGEQRTIYAPPSWVPKEECPGVLLFDDGNRASQRIMKGLMQLVQDYRTISWSIPRGWTIVFTGNPDNRFNQVTSMDSAQLSRMKFVTLVPDAVEWAAWAEDNGIDKRLVNFILRYPEMIVGPLRTNPRSLAEFGRSLKRFKKLDEDSESGKKCLVEAYASLDDCTVEPMMVFFRRKVEMIIDPEDIMSDYEKVKDKLESLMSGKEPRIDIVNVINDRIYAKIISDGYQFDKKHVGNVQSWLLDEHMPKDTAFAFLRRLAQSSSKYKKNFFAGNRRMTDIIKIAFSDDVAEE